MKKTVFWILLFSLVIGIPLMILDTMEQNKDDFNVPRRFQKVVVDLSEKARTDELLFESELKAPSGVEFFMQSDAEGEKNVKIVSESKILGLKSPEINFRVGQYTGTASTSGTYILDAGKYSVYLTGEKTDGKVVIGYQETIKDFSEFERLSKIHEGELNNPPEGYEKIYSTQLNGLFCKDEIIYTLTLNKATDIGLSVYISSEKGHVSVDLIGTASSYYGLVHPEYNRICDQLEATLPAGEYQFKLTCENADGEVYLFFKQ